MKGQLLKQTVLAWLLLLCMLPLSVTKITHRHGQEQTACCAEHHCEGGDADSSDHPATGDPCCCQICKFTLSPYLVTETPPIVLYSRLISCEPVCDIPLVYVEPVHSTLLRAPPLG